MDKNLISAKIRHADKRQREWASRVTKLRAQVADAERAVRHWENEKHALIAQQTRNSRA